MPKQESAENKKGEYLEELKRGRPEEVEERKQKQREGDPSHPSPKPEAVPRLEVDREWLRLAAVAQNYLGKELTRTPKEIATSLEAMQATEEELVEAAKRLREMRKRVPEAQITLEDAIKELRREQ